MTVPILFEGGGGDDTLVGQAVNSLWELVGPDMGRVGGIDFTGVENLTGGADNEDTFTFMRRDGA